MSYALKAASFCLQSLPEKRRKKIQEEEVTSKNL